MEEPVAKALRELQSGDMQLWTCKDWKFNSTRNSHGKYLNLSSNHHNLAIEVIIHTQKPENKHLVFCQTRKICGVLKNKRPGAIWGSFCSFDGLHDDYGKLEAGVIELRRQNQF
jgi:hypothetical protein